MLMEQLSGGGGKFGGGGVFLLNAQVYGEWAAGRLCG